MIMSSIQPAVVRSSVGLPYLHETSLWHLFGTFMGLCKTEVSNPK